MSRLARSADSLVPCFYRENDANENDDGQKVTGATTTTTTGHD